jgi:hypothetical protein
MTRYELLNGKVDAAYAAWRIRPYGFGSVVYYLRYVYLKHKLYSMPLYEAELEVSPRRSIYE